MNKKLKSISLLIAFSLSLSSSAFAHTMINETTEQSKQFIEIIEEMDQMSSEQPNTDFIPITEDTSKYADAPSITINSIEEYEEFLNSTIEEINISNEEITPEIQENQMPTPTPLSPSLYRGYYDGRSTASVSWWAPFSVTNPSIGVINLAQWKEITVDYSYTYPYTNSSIRVFKSIDNISSRIYGSNISGGWQQTGYGYSYRSNQSCDITVRGHYYYGIQYDGYTIGFQTFNDTWTKNFNSYQ